VPVAAYPVSGPKDVLTDPRAGVLRSNLREASLRALDLDREAARQHALLYSWENSARQFIENVLVAHNMGLPERQARFRRWRHKRNEQMKQRRERRRQKKTARLGGNRAVSLSCVSLGDALGELASSQKWLGTCLVSRAGLKNFGLPV